MTIQDLPDATRCSGCGAWLPRTAIDCPRCGRPRDMAMSGVPDDPRRRRRLLIAGSGMAVLSTAVGLLVMFNPDGALHPSPSPPPGSAVALETASPVPTPRPTPRPTPTRPPASIPQWTSIEPSTPSPTPLPPVVLGGRLVLPLSIPDIGRHALVSAGALRVRDYPGLDRDVRVQLARGSEVLLVEGPVPADGYDWYRVYYMPGPEETRLEDGGGWGWLAAGEAGAPPSFLDLKALHCPAVAVTPGLLASLGTRQKLDCLDRGPYAFSGVIEQCLEGPYYSYVIEPQWLWFSCFSIVELGSNSWLSIHMPPGVMPVDGLERGDVVSLVGHVDDPAAATCEITSTDPEYVENETDLAFARLDCQGAFVIDEIEVTGHINLPDYY